MQLRRSKRRGIGTVFATAIFVFIMIFMTGNLIVWGMTKYASYQGILDQMTQRDQTQHAEQLSISSTQFGSSTSSDNSTGAGNNVAKFSPPFSVSSSPSLSIIKQLNQPRGLAFDSSGNLWVTSTVSNSTIEYTASSSYSRISVAMSNGLDAPEGIAFNQGHLWVASTGSNKVLEFTTLSNTSTASATVSTGLSSPKWVAFDSSNNLWVSSSGSNKIVEFTAASSYASVGTTVTSSISSPGAITFDSSGNLWVANTGSNNILKFASPYTGSPALTVTNGVNYPRGLAFDSSGNLWVANTGNVKALVSSSIPGTFLPILEMNFTDSTQGWTFGRTIVGGVSSGIAGGYDQGGVEQGAIGSPSGPGIIYAGVSYFPPPPFSNPEGLAFDSSGNLWATDTSNARVIEFSRSQLSGTTLVQATSLTSSLVGPAYVAFDSSGNLWVSDTFGNDVLQYQPPLSTQSTPHLTITASMSSPTGIALDSSKNLWVANSGTNTIVEFTAASSYASKGTTISVGLNSPGEIAFDSSGNLWVANTGSNSVIEYTVASGYTTIGATLTANLNTPNALVFDSSGNLFVTSGGNNQVYEFTTSNEHTGGASVAIGNKLSGLSTPHGIVADSSGNLWVADTGNARIVKFIKGTSSYTMAPIAFGGIVKYEGVWSYKFFLNLNTQFGVPCGDSLGNFSSTATALAKSFVGSSWAWELPRINPGVIAMNATLRIQNSTTNPLTDPSKTGHISGVVTPQPYTLVLDKDSYTTIADQSWNFDKSLIIPTNPDITGTSSVQPLNLTASGSPTAQQLKNFYHGFFGVACKNNPSWYTLQVVADFKLAQSANPAETRLLFDDVGMVFHYPPYIPAQGSGQATPGNENATSIMQLPLGSLETAQPGLVTSMTVSTTSSYTSANTQQQVFVKDFGTGLWVQVSSSQISQASTTIPTTFGASQSQRYISPTTNSKGVRYVLLRIVDQNLGPFTGSLTANLQDFYQDPGHVTVFLTNGWSSTSHVVDLWVIDSSGHHCFSTSAACGASFYWPGVYVPPGQTVAVTLRYTWSAGSVEVKAATDLGNIATLQTSA